MVYRNPDAAPLSAMPPARRGAVVGRICKTCYEAYPLHRSHHRGHPLYGKDHVASPCAHEGDEFVPGEEWWEPAVAVLPAPPGDADAEAAASSP